MTTLSAYTGQTPATGYVGYVNFTQDGDQVRITVRPESADGSGTVVLSVPATEFRRMCVDALSSLDGGSA